MSTSLHHEYGVEKVKNTVSTKPRRKSLTFCQFNIFRSCINNPVRVLPEQRNLVMGETIEFHIELLKSDKLARKLISPILSSLDVPEAYHAQIIYKITSMARSILSKATTKNGSATKESIMVAISAVTSKIYTLEEYEAMRSAVIAMDAAQFNPIPATKSSIEALERVVLDDFGFIMQECMICKEEFQAGLEIARMPCSHIYHGDCIVQWLETSHMCPLCRFPMPHDH